MVFEKVAQTTEIQTGQIKNVKLGNKEVLIANVNGAFYAIGNICTHMGGTLSKGTLQGNIITCPKHKAQFDVITGKVVSHPKIPLMHPKIADQTVYKVKVEGTDILVEQP
jgi:3-phenylpropionate/trans-cinnamate dioxygenase ferredoxin component